VISVGLGQCFEFRSLAVDQGRTRPVGDFCWFGSVF